MIQEKGGNTKIEWRSKAILVLGVVLLAANIVLFSAEAVDRAQAAGRIEYKVIPIPISQGPRGTPTVKTEDLQSTLDKMGKEGWNLVALEETIQGHIIFRK